MILDPINETIEAIRRRWVAWIMWSVRTISRTARWYLHDYTPAKVRSRIQGVTRGNHGLGAASLSFFDDFHVVDGVSVFVLDPDRLHPISDRKSTMTDSQPQLPSKITFYENKNAITCCKISADGTRVASGHDNGSVMIWSTEHGTLLNEQKNLHKRSPVADISFLGESNTMILSCDFHGQTVAWDTSNENRINYTDCSQNWLNESLLGPKIRWPMFSKSGTCLMYPVTYFIKKGGAAGAGDTRAILSRTQLARTHFEQECSIFLFDTSRATPLRENQAPDAFRVLSVAAKSDATDFTFASGEFSGSCDGLLVGFNARPFGFMIVWPDFRNEPDIGFRLDGTMGCWCPTNDFIATWDIQTKGSSRRKKGVCYLWAIDELGKAKRSLPSDSTSSRRWIQATDPIVLSDPQGGNVFWAHFLPHVLDDLGIATCVVKDQLEIIVWHVESKTMMHRLTTGIARDETRLDDIQAWDNQWVHVQRSYGLKSISCSQDGRWLGVYSADANKGFLWEANTGIEVLRFSMPEHLQRNAAYYGGKKLLDMDMSLSNTGNRFLLCNEEHMLVWCPRSLSKAANERSGVNTLALKSADMLINHGHVTCRFSLDGEMVGMCRSYSLVMDIWSLKDGRRQTLVYSEDANPNSEQDVDTLLRAKLASTIQGQDSENLAVEDDEGSLNLTSVSKSVYRRSGLRSGDVIEVDTNSSRFCQFAFSADGSRVVTCMGDLTVLLWELDSQGDVVTSASKIASLRSRYTPAWDACFSTDPNGVETVVVCEDTGVLVWISLARRIVISRRQGNGLKRCRFSADGSRGVLMRDATSVHVWNLVERRMIQAVEFNLWLGPTGTVPFPHNVSMTGTFAFVGVRKDVDPLKPSDGFMLCTPNTTEEDLRDLGQVPLNLCLADRGEWVVIDKFIDPPVRRIHPEIKIHEAEFAKTDGGTFRKGDQSAFAGGGTGGSRGFDDVQNEKPNTTGSVASDTMSVDVSLPPNEIESDVLHELSPVFESDDERQPLLFPKVSQQTHVIPQAPIDGGKNSLGDQPSERYPLTSNYSKDESWQYLLTNELLGPTDPTDTLTILHVDGIATPKVLRGEKLLPHRFIAISHDGRRVACLSESGRLFVWNAYATQGCLPDWNDLSLAGDDSKGDVLDELLNSHGPGILNYPDHEARTIPMHAISERNHALLSKMVSWSVQNRVMMGLISESLEGTRCEMTTALDLALGRRSPECSEILLQHLPHGLTTRPATMAIYAKSLLPLSRIYPSAFLDMMCRDHLFFQLPTIMVPENTFKHREFKVITSDTLIPPQADLQKMWKDMLRKSKFSEVVTDSDEGVKMVPAIPRVVPYPDIAQIGMNGFLKQLSTTRIDNRMYSTFLVKAIIHSQWRTYGRRLLHEEIWHFSLLWLLFTSYAVILGGLWTLISFENFWLGGSKELQEKPKNMAAAALLVMAWILGVVGMIREISKIYSHWAVNRYWGLLRFSQSQWNWLDVLTYIILVAVIGPLHFGISAGNSSSIRVQNRLTVMVSTLSILLSAKMLRYAQGFRTTAPMVLMIKEIVKAILVFLVIAFGLMFGFAIAFFVLFRVPLHRPCLGLGEGDVEDELLRGGLHPVLEKQKKLMLKLTGDEVECLEAKEDVGALFGNVGLALLTSFGMMLGETQLDSLSVLDGSLRVVATIMVVIYLLSIMVVLLNLLIAVMGDSFDRVKSTEELQFLKGRAQVIHDMELMMSAKNRKEVSSEIGRYLHVLTPKQEDLQATSTEWKGRLFVQNLLLKNELRVLLKEIKSNSDSRFRDLVEILRANGMEIPELEITQDFSQFAPYMTSMDTMKSRESITMV
ncbi:hypothetical protein BSKO_12560 [Bryopsis sp. KO-2023]|nr:hypothetical protein BSKO_12560 [Bryopsis sp. KO-2023]